MMSRLYEIVRPVAFALEPERAHEAALRAIECGFHPSAAPECDPRLAVTLFGLRFPNPVGLAAGFDKDARVPDAMLAFGFGHVEIGSVTPLPQPGNPRPRLFRLASDRAIINRMGFNSAGQEAVARRLGARKAATGIIGVNLGANKLSEDKTADFEAGVARLGGLASFLTINISSPNTPGLRDLQSPDALSNLLERLDAARGSLTKRTGRKPPMIVKLSPDISDDNLPEVVRRLVASSIDAIAISNTTLEKRGLSETVQSEETGGLSGRPLFRRATRLLARIYKLSEGKLPLIGIGGVESAETAVAKIAAGASLVQLYTGMIYMGPGLPDQINRRLARDLDRRGYSTLSALCGLENERWCRAEL